MSIDRGMNKEDVAHIYNGILLSHKKEINNAICSKVDGTRDSHTKWNLSERERNTIWYHLFVESKIWNRWSYLKITNKQKTETDHGQEEQTCGS